MNILTFDIEDWYCNCVYTDLDWEKYECRLYEGVDMILEELKSSAEPGTKKETR